MAEHSIVHVEFSSNDPEASAKFYSELFGWKVEHAGQFNYWMFTIDEKSGGGFNEVGTEQMPFIKPGDAIVYISTGDIEGDLAKAESLGGQTVTPKMDIPGMGAFGIFRDPTGNLVGLFTSVDAAASTS